MTIEGLRLRARNSYVRATASCRKKASTSMILQLFPTIVGAA